MGRDPIRDAIGFTFHCENRLKVSSSSSGSLKLSPSLPTAAPPPSSSSSSSSDAAGKEAAEAEAAQTTAPSSSRRTRTLGDHWGGLAAGSGSSGAVDGRGGSGAIRPAEDAAAWFVVADAP